MLTKAGLHMARLFESPAFIIVLIIGLVIFGGAKLPGIAKNLGQSMRVFRKEMKTMNDEKTAEKDAKAASNDDSSNDKQ
jgi:sec-independent protein translocase protein TatA